MKEVYKELSALIKAKVPGVKHIDLWRNQTDFFSEEDAFPLPAVFIEFNTNSIEDLGLLVQDLNTVVSLHVVTETLADSFEGSTNQEAALLIFDLLEELHKALHGKHGASFTTMHRVALRSEETGTNVVQYAQHYSTIIRDYSAKKEYAESPELSGFKIEKAVNVVGVPDEPLFDVGV